MEGGYYLNSSYLQRICMLCLFVSPKEDKMAAFFQSLVRTQVELVWRSLVELQLINRTNAKAWKEVDRGKKKKKNCNCQAA